MRTLVCLTAMAVALPLANGVAAQTVDARDANALAEIIRSEGYRAAIDADSAGDPMINSAVSGTDFSIFFFGCENNADCKWLVFRVGYDMSDGSTLQAMNDWNKDKLFGRAYLDDENDPWLEMAVNVDFGVTRANFADTFDWWEVIVGEFEDHIGW